MPEELACPNCNCQSVIYPQIPADQECVVCRLHASFCLVIRMRQNLGLVG
jgi:hypothetical protein